MDNKAEVRDFLVTRRARITPEQAGLPAWGGHRRVAGLRREEVALLKQFRKGSIADTDLLSARAAQP